MSARRIALLTPCFWPEVRRGGERILHELAVGLRDRGHVPRIIAGHPARSRRAVEDGLEVMRVRRPPDGCLRRRGFEDYLTHLPFSYAALARGDDDLAEAFFPTDALVAARWSRRTDRPAVFYFMGIPDRGYLEARRGRASIMRRAVAGAAAVAALSQTAADAFERWLGVEARVIHPGIDLAAFAPGEGRAPEPTIACLAAPEVPRKRVGLLVEAFALLRRDRPAARLLLLRPGDPALERKLRGPGIELLEPVEDSCAVAATYRRAWVSALPSLGDSFGLVAAEALACGTPVVATSHGALPEVVDRPEVGRLFSGDDPAALATALLQGLELAQEGSTPAACRARAEEFGTERSVAAHEALYDELLR